MFHDDIIDNLKERVAHLTPSTDEEILEAGELEWTPADTERIYKLFTIIPPAVFYYNASDIDTALVTTGVEFFREGILKPPFMNCIFVKKQPDKPDIAFLVYQIDDKSFYGFHMSADRTMDTQIYRFKMDGEVEVYLTKQSDQLTGENIEENYKSCGGNIFAAMMLLSSAASSKERHEISPQLAHKRNATGKPPLQGYTTIRLNYPSAGASGGQGTHASPRPHWRRGHIRTMSTGRKIPIAPCLINFDGSILTQKPNIYTVAK